MLCDLNGNSIAAKQAEIAAKKAKAAALAASDVAKEKARYNDHRYSCSIYLTCTCSYIVMMMMVVWKRW